MGRHKRLAPKDMGNGEYCYVDITVERKPQIEFVVNEQPGAIAPQLKGRRNPTFITFPILIDPNGLNVFEANLFMRSLAQSGLTHHSLDAHIRALLLFYRWMKLEGKTIYGCTDEQELGAVYLFRDFLVENLKRDEIDKNGNSVEKGVYQPSTAASYVRTIIRYYEFLHVERIIRFSKTFVPFEYRLVKVKRKAKSNDHNMLGHIKSNESRTIEVETTGLTRPFGRVQIVKSHHRLSPMREDEKQILLSYLSIDDSNFELSHDVKNLMLYTAIETGLRLKELVTFPATEVRELSFHEEVANVTISEVRNGCKTKSSKERTIEVPRHIMEILLQYKHSKARLAAQCRCNIKHNGLFLNPREGLPFAPNTLETYFSDVRNEIIKKHPDWYFTVHDLRATYATHWLYREHSKRNLLFEVLINELADLMGHSSTQMTEKYISYMNTDKYWLEFASRKNSHLAILME
ncbi:tyrosine-type recombinase/integrase [Vibrio splendidus]|uniref:Tyr recombinase domain-containing protein n=1 Tax=Vibrio splendidus TaxID=29497 RepID=A0A2N7JZC8_VIBSP|nr:site-specific integrase [Vibrio splendidus]PMM65992.1 hypothetical protein BCT54_16245 [Vibrio splendidus]